MTARAGHGESWAPPNKRMHATRGTRDVIKRNLAGGRVMRGVGRLIASPRFESSRAVPHDRKESRLARRAWFSSAGCRGRVGYCAGRAPRCLDAASPPNKRMHATRDTNHVIKRNLAGGRVMRGVMRYSIA